MRPVCFRRSSTNSSPTWKTSHHLPASSFTTTPQRFKLLLTLHHRYHYTWWVTPFTAAASWLPTGEETNLLAASPQNLTTTSTNWAHTHNGTHWTISIQDQFWWTRAMSSINADFSSRYSLAGHCSIIGITSSLHGLRLQIRLDSSEYTLNINSFQASGYFKACIMVLSTSFSFVIPPRHCVGF